MTQTELIKLWIINGLSESKKSNKKGSLKDLANSITLPYTTDSVEIKNNLEDVKYDFCRHIISCRIIAD